MRPDRYLMRRGKMSNGTLSLSVSDQTRQATLNYELAITLLQSPALSNFNYVEIRIRIDITEDSKVIIDLGDKPRLHTEATPRQLQKIDDYPVICIAITV